MIIACWNSERHEPQAWQWQELKRRLLEANPNVICCPECWLDYFDSSWHPIFSEHLSGQRNSQNERKIGLWSRNPWTNVDTVGSSEIPPGRFVRGTTEVEGTEIEVIGLCIPYAMSNVRVGRGGRTKWEEHRLYLQSLGELIRPSLSRPTIVLGDFNQRIPRTKWGAKQMAAMLEAALAEYRVWTEALLPGLEEPVVCHIAGSSHFALERSWGETREHLGKPLSDHDGVFAEIGIKP